MKNILKNLFAALLLAGFAVTAQAKEEKADELGNKIALEIMQELIEHAKAPTEEEIGRLMLKKMQEHLDEFKSAMSEDCVQEYGKDKSKQCQCVTDNLDYKGSFALLE